MSANRKSKKPPPEDLDILALDFSTSKPSANLEIDSFKSILLGFSEFGSATRFEKRAYEWGHLDVFVNEYWTARQRQAHSMHEVSYRACFKPQLPRFFIDKLTKPGDLVYDPFMGRGTTLLEAALMGRVPVGCDVNPLSKHLIRPRLNPVTLQSVADRLAQIDLSRTVEIWEDLKVFYHEDTLRELTVLKEYFIHREASGLREGVDDWIRMVATNRLTGHSPGFFSVYSMPPNQAVSLQSQRKINEKRNQIPPKRDIRRIILKKSKQLLGDLTMKESAGLKDSGSKGFFVTSSCDRTPEIGDGTVQLVVTSPPFLDIVDYRTDNWLRCWFNEIDASQVPVWSFRKEMDWMEHMGKVFTELYRILKPGGYVAFEVGEVRGGMVFLENLVVPAARSARLEPVLLLINQQVFTKTSNCWGVENLEKGTNSNRVVLLRKPV